MAEQTQIGTINGKQLQHRQEVMESHDLPLLGCAGSVMDRGIEIGRYSLPYFA